MRNLSSCCLLCLQLFLSLSYYSFAFPSCRPDQSSALLDFKNSFSIRKPLPSSVTFDICDDAYETISYPKTSTWKNGTNCCLWDGVTCNPLGHVIGLNLNCSWLHGKLLPNNSLFQLIHLQILDLSGNDFHGSQISSTFSQLVSLTDLSLILCNFSGEVPSQISHLHKLVSLNIWEIFNHLILKENTWERVTTNITQIKDLRLAGVDMSSILLSHLVKNISSSLISLWLAEARLQGNLDEKLFSFPHLQELYLQYNPNLTGYLPKSNWSNSMTILYLDNTSFTGKFPHSIGLMSSLNELSLSSCRFVGELPPSLWNLSQLTYLDLSNNNFSGQISSSLSNLQNLQELDLSNNGFHGTIPSGLFTLPSLYNLHLGSNQFNGYIGEISTYSLESIDVSDNKLYGSIPRSIFRLQNLRSLNFSHNFLTGNVSLHYFSWKNMYSLDLSDNFLQGELHSSICNASKLDVLYLSNNNFIGTIPHCIGSDLSLFALDLSYNSLQGELHSSICNVSNLDILNLSNNNFINTIPHCIVGSNLNLSVLDLQMNNFSGIVPQSFEVGINLRTLNLNGNILQGSIPQSLVNCTRLRVLDLGNNNIEDVFPLWLQALEELQVLVLRQNKLHGFIPNFKDNRCHAFPKLRVLDLSSNSLNGPLPASFFKSFEAMKKLDGQIGLHYLDYGGSYHDSIELIWKGSDIHLEKILTVFTSIDLSNNMFEGEIPQVIGELLALKGVNLSHNRLTGAIPASTGNLRNLEWLDLSSNNLTGKIPAELTNLNFLGVLNLSRNQLEGCIPRGQQFETFSSDSFEENKKLRGFQLMIPCTTHEERQEPFASSEVGFEFGWKPVALGYVCGAAFGATLFQLVMFSGKPLWVASVVNDMLMKRKRRVRSRPVKFTFLL